MVDLIHPYCTLAELKSRLTVIGSGQDTIIGQAIEAASRQIDGLTNRRFYAEAGTRYYTADGSTLVIDDLASLSTLKTDGDGDRVYETTWATTDFDLEPFNAEDLGHPYTQIVPTPNGTRAFTSTRRGVEIVGDWGWPAVPHAIREACLLIAARFFKRRDAPFGIAGTDQLGTATFIVAKDPDVMALIAPYRRFALGAI